MSMSPEEKAEMESLRKEVRELKALVTELAIIQGEALNAASDLVFRLDDFLEPLDNASTGGFFKSDLHRIRQAFLDGASDALNVAPRVSGGDDAGGP